MVLFFLHTFIWRHTLSRALFQAHEPIIKNAWIFDEKGIVTVRYISPSQNTLQGIAWLRCSKFVERIERFRYTLVVS